MKKYFQHYKSIPISNVDKLSGLIIYPVGDLIAQWILGDISVLRLAIVAVVGRFVYAIEIPKWFGFISTWERATVPVGFSRFFWVKERSIFHFNWLGKTIGATLWFHPLWIARHMIVLEMASILMGKTNFIEFLSESVYLGTVSFLMQFPVAVTVNYIIICRLSERSRFIWASIFSGLLAIYYAIGRVYL